MLPSQREVQDFDADDSDSQNEVSLPIVATSKAPKWQRAKILPRIASFFQFLQNSESEIQRQVNEMNEVTPFTYTLSMLTRLAAS